MKHENYIKEKLTDHESPTDLNSMWANLAKDLDQEQNKRQGIWYWGLRLLPVLLLLSIVAWLIYPSLIEMTQNKNKAVSSSETTSENTKDAVKSLNDFTIEQQELTNTNSDKVIEQKERNSTTKNTSKLETEIKTRTTKNFSSNDGTTSISSRTTLTRTTAPAVSSGRVGHYAQQNTTIQESINPVHSDYQQKAIQSTIDAELPSAGKTNIFPVVLKLDNLKLRLERLSDKLNLLNWDRKFEKRLPELDESAEPAPINPKVTKDPYIWRASINYGQTSSLFRHRTDIGIAEILNLTDNNLATRNNSFGVSLDRVSDKGLKIGLDLNYINHGVIHARDEELEKTTTGERSVVFINRFNEMVSNQIFEDLETSELAIWTFRNRHNLHSLELAATIGKEWNKGKMDFGIAAGPGINYIFAEDGFLPSGRLDFENDFIDTEAINQEISYNKVPNLLLSAKLKAQVGYHLTPRVRWYGEFTAAQLIGNTSNKSEINTRLAYFGGRTGLSYNL